MTAAKKKPEPKAQQEPPAEQQPEIPEPPMAAPAPSIEDRLSALELANIELEKRLKKHEEYHFGRVVG